VGKLVMGADWLVGCARAFRLMQEFLQMVRKLEGEHLDAWPNAVAASQIEELQRFANGLERTKLLSSWD
jgi:hypothetical protein